MKRNITKILLSLCLFIAALPSFPAMAGNEPVTFTAEMDSENMLQVTFSALNVTDVYAYDLQFTFDSLRLELVKAASGISGFSVDPIVEGNEIRFAHTLIGPRAGVEGDVQLVTLTFQRIAAGESWISWDEARLVDADLVRTTYQPNLQTAISAAPTSLADISGHWAQAAIEEAVERGIVFGYPDGTFRPQERITRAEFTVMLVRALQLPVQPDAPLSFTDRQQIPDWASPSVAAAYDIGLLSGYEDHTFRADQLINRTEMAVMLVRASGSELGVGVTANFADAEQIPDWGYSYVAAAAEAGLVQGREHRIFAPYDMATRAETVVAILNLLRSMQ